MSFIRSSNGTFHDKEDQQEYDEVKSATGIAHQSIDHHLFDTVNARLRATDRHYALIKVMLDASKANLNLSQQAIMPLICELTEYTLKSEHSRYSAQHTQAKELLSRQKSHNSKFKIILNTLSVQALNIALSMLEGSQSAQTMHKYFNTISDADVIKMLKEKIGIIDRDLLDGFIACRKKYGFFLSEAAEASKAHDHILAQMKPEEVEEFNVRWNKIKKLTTVDMVELEKLKNRTQNSKVSNLLANLIYSSLNEDRVKLAAEIEAGLNEVFSDKYLIPAAKVQP